MRLFLFLVFCSVISLAFGQKANFSSNKTIVYGIPVNCLTIIPDKPIKTFHTSGEYVGKVAIQAQWDTLTMKLIKHKIIFANLHSKLNPSKQIVIRLNKKSGDTKYLDTILPDLIQHLKYLKFEIAEHGNCVITTIWTFPITVK